MADNPNSNEKSIEALEESMMEKPKRKAKSPQGERPRAHSPISAKKREQMEISRRNLLKVGGALAAAMTTIPLAYLAEKLSGYSPSVGSMGLDLDGQSSEQGWKPDIEPFTDNEQAELNRLQAKGEATLERDEFTNNFLDPRLNKEFIQEPLIKKEVHGKIVTGKRSVVERFAAAWEVLGEHNIMFKRNNCDFSTNKAQYTLLRSIPEDVPGYGGPMTLGFHVAGQAFDVGNMSMIVTSAEGEKIQKVMTAFGFRWGVETENVGIRNRIKAVWSDAFTNGFEVYKGEKDAENAWVDLRKNSLKTGAVKIDRVHFEMRASDLKNADPISVAKKKAEAVFATGGGK